MIIPVFDVKDDECVCGKSGKRSTYTTLNSVYGNNIFEIIDNFKDLGVSVVYVADLNKITDTGDNHNLISEINKKIPVMLDCGASSLEEINTSMNYCTYPILATETMTSIDDVEGIFKKIPHNNIIISIDLLDNELLIKNKQICLDDIISLINKIKPSYTIILNLSQVGTKEGNINTTIQNIIDKTPYTQHIIAGGLTNESINVYKKNGIDNFLVGTILHNGTLSSEHKW